MTRPAGGGRQAAAGPALAPLGHAAFRRLWAAQTLSALGTRLATVTLVVFVTELGGDPGDVSVVLAAYAVPLLCLLLIGGVWADRLPRHRVMAAADCARAALHGGVAVLIFTGAASVGLLVVLGGLFGAADAFGRPAYSGLVPQTVPEQALQRANAVLGGSQNVAEFAGPALATVLLASGGAGYAFALDAATFALSALLVVSLRLPRAAPRRSPAPLRSELAEGLRQVETRPWIWLMLLVAAGLLLAGFAPWLVLGPSVAGEVYGSADAFAWLVAAAGLGTVAGALVGVRLRAASPVLASVTVLGTWPLLLASFGIGAPLPAVGCLAVLAGGAVALANVWWETALARHVPSESLSRVAACDWIASLGLLPVGYLLAGAAAAALGAQAVLLWGATMSAALIGAVLLSRPARRGLRTLRTEPAAR